MSLARDDIGSVSNLDALETRFIKTGTVEQKPDIEKKISDSQVQEPEFRDVYEKKVNTTDKKFEKIQEDYNDLEKHNQTLDEVNSRLESIEQTVEMSKDSEFSRNFVEKNVEKIEKIVEEVVLDDENLSEQSEEIAEEQRQARAEDNADSLKTAQERDESLKRIQELKEKVREKQEQILQLQKELSKEVTSTVKLDVNENVSSIEAEMPEIKDLKKAVIAEIEENPEQSKKMQIRNLSSNLLLAMLSLRQ